MAGGHVITCVNSVPDESATLIPRAVVSSVDCVAPKHPQKYPIHSYKNTHAFYKADVIILIC